MHPVPTGAPSASSASTIYQSSTFPPQIQGSVMHSNYKGAPSASTVTTVASTATPHSSEPTYFTRTMMPPSTISAPPCNFSKPYQPPYTYSTGPVSQRYPLKANPSERQGENVITQAISTNERQDNIASNQVYNPPMADFDPTYLAQYPPQIFTEAEYAHQQHQGYNPFLYETKRLTQDQYPTLPMNYLPHRQPVPTR